MTPWRVRLLVAAARRLRGPLRLAGVDPDEALLLLETRLLLEHRRAAGSGAVASLIDAMQTVLLILSVHLSVAMGAFAFLLDGPFAWMTACQGILALLVAFVTLTVHVPLLLETDDLAVIAPLPIRERSYLAVRGGSVVLSLGALAGALTLPAACVATLAYRSALVVPLVVAGSIATTAVAAGGVALVVVAAVRLADPARARDVATTVQVGAFAALLAAVYVLPPLVERAGLEAVVAAEPRWWAFVPPAHAGGLLRLGLGQGRPGDGLLAALVVVVPVAILTALRLATGRGLLASLAAAASRAGRSRRRRGESWSAALWTAPGAERAGFEFAGAVARTERRFRTTMLVAPLAIALPALGAALQLDGASSLAPFVPYLCCIVALFGASAIVESEDWRARVVFLGLDADDRGDLVRGAARRLVHSFVLLPSVVWVAGCLLLAPAAGGAGAIAAAAAALAIGTFALRRILDTIPFTLRPGEPRRVVSLLTLLGLNALPWAAAGVHAAVSFVPLGETALAGAWVVLAAIAARRFARWRPVVAPVALPADDVAPA